MSARDTGDDTADTDAVQDLVDGMPEFANETTDMLREVLAERDATTAEADIVTLADVDMTADEMDTIAAETKAWVPYRGTRGGQGWRNTITQRVVYEDEPPAADDDVDIDEIDMDDVMDVQISSLPVMDELDARDAMVGRPVEVQTENDRLVDGEITAVDPDSIEVTDERGTERTYDISGTDVDGEVYMEYPTFYASGVAGTEQSLLPDEGEPNGPQLAAEALRRAAEIDSYYETDKLEEFVGEARSRGVDEEQVEAAVELAIDTHPGLHDTEYDDIMGQETTQAGDMTGESLYAHLSDVTVSRAEMHEITNTDPAWDHVSVMGGVGWHNTATDEVIYASTPEGVPDNYVYVPPDEEVGDEYDTVTSPQGATYRSPQPVGDDLTDDGGFNEADAKDFVSSNEVGELDDINDSSKWDDPPGTVESLEAGDKIAIMNPRTFQFESAVVREAFSDDGVAEVLTDSQSNVSISAADVVAVWNEAGGELARISAADLRDQVTQVGSIDDIIDAVDAPDYFTDELQERFDGSDLQDPDQFVDDLRELIDENDDDFRIGLNDTLPQLRNALAEQGAFPQDKTNPYDIDVQSGGDVNVAFDDVIDNDFATDYDRAIALDNLVQERTGRDDLEVINADTKSQRSIVQTIEFADESGILDNLERGIERESNTSKRGQSYGWYSGGKITLKDNVSFERLEALEGSTSVSETPGEVLLHELGHANHDESRGGLPPGVVNDLEIDADLVEDEVSGYAKTNENEFVAEVFLGRLKGEDYSDEILDYYEESIGPDLPPGVEGALNTDALTDSEAEQAEATNQDDEEFTTFSECTEVNSDKSDPSAYCAVIFGFDMDEDDDTEQELLTDGGQPNELDDREQIIQEVKEGAPDDLATPWLEEAIAIAVEAYEEAEK